MKASPVNPKPISKLISSALTSEINNKELFHKGIECSYYYEEEE